MLVQCEKIFQTYPQVESSQDNFQKIFRRDKINLKEKMEKLFMMCVTQNLHLWIDFALQILFWAVGIFPLSNLLNSIPTIPYKFRYFPKIIINYLKEIMSTKTGIFEAQDPSNAKVRAMLIEFTETINNELDLPSSNTFEIQSVWIQFLNGINYFYHLKSHQGEGFSVNLHRDENLNTNVTKAVDGFINPLEKETPNQVKNLGFSHWIETNPFSPKNQTILINATPQINSIMMRDPRNSYILTQSFLEVNKFEPEEEHVIFIIQDKQSVISSDMFTMKMKPFPKVKKAVEGYHPPKNIQNLPPYPQLIQFQSVSSSESQRDFNRNPNIFNSLAGQTDSNTWTVQEAWKKNNFDGTDCNSYFAHIISSDGSKYSAFYSRFNIESKPIRLYFIYNGFIEPTQEAPIEEEPAEKLLSKNTNSSPKRRASPTIWKVVFQPCKLRPIIEKVTRKINEQTGESWENVWIINKAWKAFTSTFDADHYFFQVSSCQGFSYSIKVTISLNSTLAVVDYVKEGNSLPSLIKREEKKQDNFWRENYSFMIESNLAVKINENLGESPFYQYRVDNAWSSNLGSKKEKIWANITNFNTRKEFTIILDNDNIESLAIISRHEDPNQ